MIYQIKHTDTGAVIFEKDCGSMRSCVEAALDAGSDLSCADLSYAELSCADLSCAELNYADLRYADLRNSDLRYAELRNSDLRGSDLRGACLIDSNLSGSNLSRANFRNASLRGVPAIPNIHKVVYQAASKDGALDMSVWHACETTHCRAGWVVTLAGNAGAELEHEMGTPSAATLIYLKSDPELEKVPNFYASAEDALADMKRLAEQ